MKTIQNKIKLSEVEINKLFQFTEKKMVRWYDLQIEIVDHLASCIEDEMTADSKLTFDLALEKVYKGFGIFGFAKIVQEREIQLAKMSKSLWWNEVRNLFRWPSVIQSSLIISLVSTVAYSVDPAILHKLFVVIYLLITTAYFIYLIRDKRLFERLIILRSGTSYITILFAFDMSVPWTNTQMSPTTFAILLSLGLLIKLTSYKLYNKIRTEAKLLYPSVFLK